MKIGMAKAAACFGDTALIIKGYSLSCGECGDGVLAYNGSPSWLAGFAEYYVGPKAGVAGIDPMNGFGVFVDPSRAIAFPAPDVLVSVTGHFNDPAAQTCVMTPNSVDSPVLDPAAVISICAQRFVATGVKSSP
jgi:hypothetical protein